VCAKKIEKAGLGGFRELGPSFGAAFYFGQCT
jgi:hypothetical protein